MSDDEDRRKPLRKKPLEDRRLPRGAPGSMRWLKGLLGRPLELQRRGGQLHVTLADRRRSPERVRADELEQVREELRARLLSQDLEHAARVMRHLVFVHDALGNQGWAGLETLPSPLLGKALVQAQMLVSQSASDRLTLLIGRLRVAKVTAELREQRQPREHGDPPDPRDPRDPPDPPDPHGLQVAAPGIASAAAVEVSETTHAEFEAMQRRWVATLSPEPTPQDLDR